ncbi:MAG: 2-phosphosulfolactate phosphatase [Bacteroidetes bacterium]|jgi:2-phosphosulfolactate phosphatase|nr:2-phosphosulfolactate phosphatase [Bacteroidota bacterium]
MKPTVEIVLSPLLLPLTDIKGKVVVIIDILRATSTICAALDNGAKSITPVISVEEALSYQSDSYLVAGERNGEKAEGFDFGNSPLEYSREVIEGKHVVLTTTNGTKCIHAAKDADEILIGSFFNLSVLVDYLQASNKPVVLFCAGWKNQVNLEDTLYAGYITQALSNSHEWESDPVEMALDLVEKAKKDPTHYLTRASHAKRFKRLGNNIDLGVCMEFNAHPVLVKYHNNKLVSA